MSDSQLSGCCCEISRLSNDNCVSVYQEFNNWNLVENQDFDIQNIGKYVICLNLKISIMGIKILFVIKAKTINILDYVPLQIRLTHLLNTLSTSLTNCTGMPQIWPRKTWTGGI